jgi:hypothetical protein
MTIISACCPQSATQYNLMYSSAATLHNLQYLLSLTLGVLIGPACTLQAAAGDSFMLNLQGSYTVRLHNSCCFACVYTLAAAVVNHQNTHSIHVEKLHCSGSAAAAAAAAAAAWPHLRCIFISEAAKSQLSRAEQLRRRLPTAIRLVVICIYDWYSTCSANNEVLKTVRNSTAAGCIRPEADAHVLQAPAEPGHACSSCEVIFNVVTAPVGQSPGPGPTSGFAASAAAGGALFTMLAHDPLPPVGAADSTT